MKYFKSRKKFSILPFLIVIIIILSIYFFKIVEDSINSKYLKISEDIIEAFNQDKIINEFYESKSNYESLQKVYEEGNKELTIYGPEAEKKLKIVSELEPKIKALKKAIDDVEPAIKEIWSLLDNDNFDVFVGHK